MVNFNLLRPKVRSREQLNFLFFILAPFTKIRLKRVFKKNSYYLNPLGAQN